MIHYSLEILCSVTSSRLSAVLPAFFPESRRPQGAFGSIYSRRRSLRGTGLFIIRRGFAPLCPSLRLSVYLCTPPSFPPSYLLSLSQSPFVCLFMYPPIFPSLLSPVSVPVSVQSVHLCSPPIFPSLLSPVSVPVSVCLSIHVPPHLSLPPISCLCPSLRLSVYLCTPHLSLPPISCLCPSIRLSLYSFTPPPHHHHLSLPPVPVLRLSVYLPPV